MRHMRAHHVALLNVSALLKQQLDTNEVTCTYLLYLGTALGGSKPGATAAARTIPSCQQQRRVSTVV